VIPRTVIDTNIWVSAILNPIEYPARLRKSFEEGDFLVIISEPMIDELVDVLYRPRIKNKYGITEADIRELIVLIEERTEYVLLSNGLIIE
jgi:putative PIN family toxin of toxin-antitoxin system